MTSGIRRAVSYGTWEALRAAIEIRLPSGTFFYATREELNPGLEVVDRTVAQSSDKEFHCVSIVLFYRERQRSG